MVRCSMGRDMSFWFGSQTRLMGLPYYAYIGVNVGKYSLVVTSATLVVTSALLVVTRSY